jgi:hypothetical protein
MGVPELERVDPATVPGLSSQNIFFNLYAFGTKNGVL